MSGPDENLLDSIYSTFEPFDTEFPDEVVRKILSFLDLRDVLNCGLVCKKWYRLAHTRTLHRRLGTVLAFGAYDYGYGSRLEVAKQREFYDALKVLRNKENGLWIERMR